MVLDDLDPEDCEGGAGVINAAAVAEVERLRKDMRKLKDYLKTSVQVNCMSQRILKASGPLKNYPTLATNKGKLMIKFASQTPQSRSR